MKLVVLPAVVTAVLVDLARSALVTFDIEVNVGGDRLYLKKSVSE